LAKASAILQDVTADQPEADLMVAPGLGVQLGEAVIRTVLPEQPVQRSRSGDGWRRCR
jgi:hypothetical protein